MAIINNPQGIVRFNARMNITYADNASRKLKKDHWRVMNKFRYYIGEKNSNRWVDVPAGYLTDGASVPRILWSLIPPWGQYGQCAAMHDYLCEWLMINEKQSDGTIKKIPILRKECDEIFYESLKVVGVPAYKRFMIQTGVSSYRIVANVNTPSLSLEKWLLEEEWRKEHNIAA